MLGGEMRIDNPPGGGARPTVRLPLAPARHGAGAAAPAH